MHAAASARPRAPEFVDPPGYARHRPETTLRYQLVEQHYRAFREQRAMAGRSLPAYVQEEFDAYLKCGRLEEKLVAFSCKKRRFCPSCGARRMAETAALLADEVLPERPLRQWVLSLPFALRFLLATQPAVLSQVLGLVYRAISSHLLAKAGLTGSHIHSNAAGAGAASSTRTTTTTTTAAVGAAVRLDRTSKIISREEPAWDCRQRGGKRCGC